MPIYLLECTKCEHQWDAFFDMNAKKEGECPKCKKHGKRVFTAPNVGIDTNINPNDLNALTAKTGKMRGTLGDLYNLAKEASDKRGGDNDPIKKKALENYAKQRNGKQYKAPRKKHESINVEFKSR